jgi:hypothetical protein
VAGGRGQGQTAECCARLLAEAPEQPEGKVKGFRPNVVGMFGYLLSHDAQLVFGMWEWGTRWKECGFGG